MEKHKKVRKKLVGNNSKTSSVKSKEWNVSIIVILLTTLLQGTHSQPVKQKATEEEFKQARQDTKFYPYLSTSEPLFTTTKTLFSRIYPKSWYKANLQKLNMALTFFLKSYTYLAVDQFKTFPVLLSVQSATFSCVQPAVTSALWAESQLHSPVYSNKWPRVVWGAY